MIVNTTARILFLGLVSSLVLSACSSTADRVEEPQAAERIQQAEERVEAVAPRLKELAPTLRPSNITVRDGIYLGRDGFRAMNGDPLPRQFEGANGISVNLGGPVDIPAFAEVINRLTNIPVDFHDLFHAPVFDEDELDPDSSGRGSSTADSASTRDSRSQPFEPQQTTSQTTTHPTERTFRVNHKGSLSDLLSYVANRLDADWTYKGGRIQFLGPQTRTYTLWSLPSDLTTTSSIGGGSGSAEIFGGASPSTTTANYTYQYWESFERSIESILPVTGATFSINRAAGNITVTGSQAAHMRVADFIERENARLSRQVAIKVDVVAFTQNDSNSHSVDLDTIFQAAAGFGVSFAGPVQSIDGASQLGATVISGRGPLKNFNGSTAILNSLAQYGRVSLVNTSSMVAGNNMPTPISIVKEKAYLAGSTRTEGDNDTTTTLDPGIINTGLNMVITPRIMSSGEVLVQYTMNITDLKGIETFAAPDGSSVIQLPETETRNFMQTVNIASGDSLVIASYESESTGRDSHGPFDPRLWGLGGQAGYSAEATKILVMMTPVVLEGRNNPRAF